MEHCIHSDTYGFTNRDAKCNDLHLKYGAHISSHHVTENLASEESKGFLPSLSSERGLLLLESDVYKLIIESLLGNANDLFTLQYSSESIIWRDNQRFCLSYAARNLHLRGTSSAALQPLLEWFASLASDIQLCRRFAYGDKTTDVSDTCRFKQIAPRSTTFGGRRVDPMTVREALQATVVELIASVEEKLCTLDAAVNTDHNRTKFTVISLYVSCRSWVVLFQNMTSLVRTILLPSPPSSSSGPNIRSISPTRTQSHMGQLITERDSLKDRDLPHHLEASAQRIESENVMYSTIHC